MPIQPIVFSTLAIIHFTLGIALLLISQFYPQKGIEYVSSNILLRAVYLSVPVMVAFNTDLSWLLYITGTFKVIFIPLIWIYFYKLGKKDKNMQPRDWLHFTIPVILLIISVFITPAFPNQNPSANHSFFDNLLKSGWVPYNRYSNLFVNARIISFIQAIVYAYQSVLLYRKFKLHINRITFSTSPHLVWMRYVIVIIATSCIIEALSLFGAQHNRVVFIASSFFMFAISLFLFLHAFLHKGLSEIELHTNPETPTKSGNDIQFLDAFMKSRELFLDPKLTISQLSAYSGIPKYRLTLLVKKSGYDNFHSYINYYRVEKSKELLQSLPNEMTIDSVSSAAGFNSRSSFFRLFKESTGMSPRQYLEKLNS